MAKIFFLNPSCVVDEFAGLLAPHQVTSFVLSCKGPLDKFSYVVDDSHVHKIRIPKLGRGKFGAKHLPNVIDFVFHTFVSFLALPYLLTHQIIIMKGPPFFDTLLMPVFRLFRKRVYLISIDDQEQNIVHYANTYYKRLYYRWALWQEKKAVRMATHVFATSKYLVDKYRDFGGNATHVPNGADVEHILAIPVKKYRKGRVISYIGGFEHWRGIDLLIDAFKDVKKKHHEKMTLLLMGGGPDLELIKKHAGEDPDIVFTGYVPHDEGTAYCKGSDLVVMPARKSISAKTISSIKCFEYLACGVPTLVTDSGEHAYWIKKFNAGLVVEDTIKGLSEGIIALFTQKNLYATLKRNAREHAKDVDYRVMKAPFAYAITSALHALKTSSQKSK